MSTSKPLSVKEISRYLSDRINNDLNLKQVTIEGEISNFTLHQSGHIYFSLKEDDTSIRAVMFRGYRQNLSFLPANGMKVIVIGDVNIYEKNNSIQVYAQRMLQSGIGDIYLKFEQLKEKLQKEGLFDPSAKKRIPAYPTSIGVITSPTGAALQDLKNVISRRYPICEVKIYPTGVQGDHAAENIIYSLKNADKGNHDTLLLIRGGGSVEDLFVFNDERIARTIYALETPIITGIGHEIDFTIADFVADLRAPTPSAAAELAVPDIRDIMMYLADTENRMTNAVVSITRKRKESLQNYMKNITSTLSYIFRSEITETQFKKKRLDSAVNSILQAKMNMVKVAASGLNAQNPLTIISRGYAKVTDSSNRNLISMDQINTGDNIKVRIKDGSFKATVTEKE